MPLSLYVHFIVSIIANDGLLFHLARFLTLNCKRAFRHSKTEDDFVTS